MYDKSIYFSYIVDDNLNPALETSVGPAEVQMPGALIEGEVEVYEVFLPVVHSGVPGEEVVPLETNDPGE